jgi:hypothetical protein
VTPAPKAVGINFSLLETPVTPFPAREEKQGPINLRFNTLNTRQNVTLPEFGGVETGTPISYNVPRPVKIGSTVPVSDPVAVILQESTAPVTPFPGRFPGRKATLADPISLVFDTLNNTASVLLRPFGGVGTGTPIGFDVPRPVKIGSTTIPSKPDAIKGSFKETPITSMPASAAADPVNLVFSAINNAVRVVLPEFGGIETGTTIEYQTARGTKRMARKEAKGGPPVKRRKVEPLPPPRGLIVEEIPAPLQYTRLPPKGNKGTKKRRREEEMERPSTKRMRFEYDFPRGGVPPPFFEAKARTRVEKYKAARIASRTAADEKLQHLYEVGPSVSLRDIPASMKQEWRYGESRPPRKARAEKAWIQYRNTLGTAREKRD